VFINLLLNSVHALEQAGGEKTIWIAATRCRETTIVGSSDLVTVEIRDSGLGIPESHLAQVFEPFFTTKSGGEGTGLGLAVVSGIIEEHGGSISAGNWSGGAIFRISIPAAPEVARV
jgi:signal transduction histidine kinase